MRGETEFKIYKEIIDDALMVNKGLYLTNLKRSYENKEDLYRKAYQAVRDASCFYDGDWLQEIESCPICPCDKCMVMDTVYGCHDEQGHSEYECDICKRRDLFVNFPAEENLNEYLCGLCANECCGNCRDCEKKKGIKTCEYECCMMCDHYIEENGRSCPQWEPSLSNQGELSKEDYEILKQKFTSYEDMYKTAFNYWLMIAGRKIHWQLTKIS